MPVQPTIEAGARFSERFPAAFAYPLQPAALTTVVALAFAQYLTLLPVFGLVFSLLCWGALYKYSFACLRHTADGYALPPEFAGDAGGGAAAVLIGVQVVTVLYLLMMPTFWGPGALVLGVVLVFFLPAISMSLAFGDGALSALNPLQWLATVNRFGAPYFLMAGIYLAIAAVQVMLQLTVVGILPRIVSILPYYLVANYATVLNFHLMGALMYAHADRLGHSPQADVLNRAMGKGADEELLDRADTLATSDLAAATGMLTERIQEGGAPTFLHTRYREFLGRAGRRAELLVHGQIWIAQLIAAGDLTKALGVVQDCQAVDPAFIPDDPRTTGPLADKASQLGMPRLARQLAMGYVRLWPKDYEAPWYALLAARMMLRLEETSTARGLLLRTRAEWPDHPMLPQVDELLADIDGLPALPRGDKA